MRAALDGDLTPTAFTIAAQPGYCCRISYTMYLATAEDSIILTAACPEHHKEALNP